MPFAEHAEGMVFLCHSYFHFPHLHVIIESVTKPSKRLETKLSMQNLLVILAVFVAAAAIIAVLFWRIKPQAAPSTDALDKRLAGEAKRAEILQSKIDANETALRSALAGASASNATAEAAKEQAANADANLKQTKNDLALLQVKHSKVEPDVATATAQREAAENARAETTQRYGDLMTRYASLQGDVNALTEKATKAEKDAASAKSEANAIRERAEIAEARSADATTCLAALNVEIGETKSLLAEVATKYEAVEKAQNNLGQRHTALLQEHNGLQADFVVTTGQASSAQTDLENRRLQIDGMSCTIETLQTDLLEERAKLNQALAKQQSNEDAIHQFENISQNILKGVLGDAKREIAELAANLHKTGSEELSRHAEKVALTLEPIQTQLHAYNEAVKDFQVGSLESHISLKEQLTKLHETERNLGDQARALTTALSSTPKYKGTYGELALERLMEHAGLQEGPHYEKQARRNTEDGLKIPDMVVKMPGNQKVIVDAKAVMGAYVAAQETLDDTERNILLKKHCENVRARVVELSAKNYFADHTDAIELVVLFLPAEPLYVAAVENDHGLADFALSRNVIICGPSLLIMLLKSASQLWRRASIEEEAQKIKNCGDAIYDAACSFIQRYADLGTKIEQLEKAYNEAAGTLNGNLIPKGRNMGKFASMANSKEVKEIDQLKDSIKPFSSPEAKKLLAVGTEKLPGLSLGEFQTAELTLSVGDE